MKNDYITITVRLKLSTFTAIWSNAWKGQHAAADQGPAGLLIHLAEKEASAWQDGINSGQAPNHFTEVQCCAWIADWETSHTDAPRTKTSLALPGRRVAWSARCDCYHDHASASGRCTHRDVVDPTRDPQYYIAICESCRANCPCGNGPIQLPL